MMENNKGWHAATLTGHPRAHSIARCAIYCQYRSVNCRTRPVRNFKCPGWIKG